MVSDAASSWFELRKTRGNLGDSATDLRQHGVHRLEDPR
jgi:hypothetical protein